MVSTLAKKSTYDFIELDIALVTYEAMTLQCGRSVVQVLVVRVDIGVVIYEAMTLQCGR